VREIKAMTDEMTGRTLRNQAVFCWRWKSLFRKLTSILGGPGHQLLTNAPWGPKLMKMLGDGDPSSWMVAPVHLGQWFVRTRKVKSYVER
jgi:hypothetical protein